MPTLFFIYHFKINKVIKKFYKKVIKNERVQKYFTIAILLLFLFLFFILPRINYLDENDISHKANYKYTFFRLSWYFSAIGLIYMFIGVIYYFKNLDKNNSLFYFSSLFLIIAFSFYLYNNGVHIYAFRRFVPLGIPAICLFIGLGVNYFLSKDKNILLKIITYSAVFYFFIFNVFNLFPFLTVSEYDGSIKQFTEINYYFENNSFILCEEGEVNHWYGPTLQFIFNHEVLIYKREFVINYLNLTKYDNVYLVAKGENQTYLGYNRIVSYLIDFPIYERRYDYLPRSVNRYNSLISIYKIK
jgi:hypothetical protein